MTTPLITRLEEAAEGSRELDPLVWASYGFLEALRETLGHVTSPSASPSSAPTTRTSHD